MKMNKFFPSEIKKYFAGPRKIFAILGIILFVELIYAYSVLSTPSPPPPEPKKTAAVKKVGGRISLLTQKKSYKVADTIPVSVLVSTGGHAIDGADLIIHYDPKVLEATAGGLIKGKILDEYPLVALDAKAGTVSISGISSLKRGYTGTGQFATLIFRAKTTGKTTLSVEFNKGSTTDSNLVESQNSKDILEVVDNVNLVVN